MVKFGCESATFISPFFVIKIHNPIESLYDNSKEWYDKKLKNIIKRSKDIPKIYFHCKYFIIEEKIKVINAEFNKDLYKEIHSLGFDDWKFSNYGYDKKGNLKCLDY